MLVDTHAHIHFEEFRNDLEQVFENAQAASLNSIICVGTSDDDSREALNFVLNPDVQNMAGNIKLLATAGIHPHEACLGEDAFLSIKEMTQNIDYQKVLIAIGECGLDYYKNFSSKSEQFRMLEWQLQLAVENDLPVVFHVRDAWDDFFAIIKSYPKTRGVIHSFTGHTEQVEIAIKHNLYFGLNGIMTFTKDELQLAAAKMIPADRILLETDCPYLSPSPMRGKRNEPSYIQHTAKFLAEICNMQLAEFEKQTTKNAKDLFLV